MREGLGRLTGEEALAEEARAVAAATPAALCLSGGGIRSAAYALGVVQALAAAGLLARFHYLSTVSGGGYTGAWLTTLLQRRGLEEVQAMLAGSARGQPAAPVARFRASGNFLTPDPGLFSLDSWTGATLYLRNFLLTWLGLVPVFLLGVLLLVMLRTLVAFAGAVDLGFGVRLPHVAMALAFALLAVATRRLCAMLPSHRAHAPSGAVAFASRHEVLGTVAALLCVPLLLTLAANPDAHLWGLAPAGIAWMLFGLYVVATVAGYGWATAVAPGEDPGRMLFLRNFAPWLFGAAIGGAALALLAWALLAFVPEAESRNTLLLVFGPVGAVVAITLHIGAHAGMRAERGRATLDREWSARLSAVMLRVAAVWAFLCFSALMLSNLVLHALSRAPAAAPFWVSAMLPLLSGPVVAWLGKQVWSQVDGAWSRATTGAGEVRAKAIDLLLKGLAVVFLAGLPAALTFFLERWLLAPLQDAAIACGLPWMESPDCAGCPTLLLMAAAQLLMLAALALVAWRVGGQPNRHSMYAIYRNRIARAFVGAALEPEEHDADPFSGFSPNEGERLAAVAQRPCGLGVLFPVVNCAVNMTGTERADWAERKALSFAASPLHCGFYVPGDPAVASYAATATFAGPPQPATARGLSLAAVVTISGAAASPNWGYHSQPETAFLMTLFNTRLGIWLPNPASPRVTAAQLAVNEPPGWWQGMRAQFGELLGYSRVDDRSIYLSDGGHFENLAAYEMLRRRCRFVLVADATMDPGGGCAALGNLVRKARIDLGAAVEIRPGTALRGCAGIALGRVTYADGTEGWLLHVKPTCADDAPADVRAYRAANAAFPHEPTSDQWFSESQFESYRRLGQHQMETLLRDAPPDGGIATLFGWLAAEGRA